MKRVWIALVLFLLVLGLCVWEMTSHVSTMRELRDSLEQAEELAARGELRQACEDMEQINSCWHQRLKILSTSLSHDQLEQVDSSIAILISTLQRENLDEFYLEYARVTSQLEHLEQTERLRLENIL